MQQPDQTGDTPAFPDLEYAASPSCAPLMLGHAEVRAREPLPADGAAGDDDRYLGPEIAAPGRAARGLGGSADACWSGY
jgi:hypothetical protein